MGNLIEVKDLDLSIYGKTILKKVGFSLNKGQVMGLVGESGSGKSITAYSIMQLLPRGCEFNGQILFDGKNLVKADEAHMCRLRGDDIAMVFQEPMTALNPLKTIGEQVIESIRLHTSASRTESVTKARDMLDRVGLEMIGLTRYPHELSGGQRQRVVIAIACALRPRLLIADEPTTALDVTVQAQILDLMKSLVTEFDMGLILISHDLGVVAQMADDITIMRHGEVVEQGQAIEVLKNQSHPYTKRLAEASTHVPKTTLPPITLGAGAASPLLKVENLTCTYRGHKTGLFSRAEDVIAVNQVSFDILPGQTLGLVGESGCGKSTLSRTLLGLKLAKSGSVKHEGKTIDYSNPDSLALLRCQTQMVFQDPYGSFNPRHKILRVVAEPLHLEKTISANEKRDRVAEALISVGLSADDMNRYPHEFSGGQRQRIAIARALVTNPKLIIADEPVSALDVSIRAQILDLLVELRERLGLACLLISHDLSVVRAICDEVMIMCAGQILERGKTETVFSAPTHDYTKTLITAAPDLAKSIAARSSLNPG